MPAPRPAIISALYAVILVLLALAAWNPTVPGGAAATDLILLLDESDSVDPEHNDRLWRIFLRHAELLPAGSRVCLIRFADRAAVEFPLTAVDGAAFAALARLDKPPRRGSLYTGASDIRAALDAALRQLTGNRHAVVWLSSDGVETVDSASSAAPPFAAASGFSLLYVEAAPASRSAALRIDSVNLPPRVAYGQSIPLSLAIASAGETGANLGIVRNRETIVDQALTLAPGELARFDFSLPPARSALQTLEFVLRDSRQNIVDRLTRVVDVGGGELLYIGNAPFEAAAFAPPRGWHSLRLPPAQLDSSETFFDGFDVVVIDDLDAASINPAVTLNLKRSVRQSGTGLVVLGGPHSFGSGGYRHSELETLLPVIAESSRPEPASAYLFLVDKSGSMEAPGDRRARLADAFAAVAESAKSIRPGDESALLAFDREVRVLLPLQPRADFGRELDRPWRIQPSGGTRLGPAIDSAAELLAQSASPRRFLVLVTDGFVEVGDTARLESALRRADIRLIALATGSDANLEPLRRLAAGSGGRLLRVADIAELPRFMRRQLESTRSSWSDEIIRPQTVSSLPFVEGEPRDWLAMGGYQVTRAKPTARIYLATSRGDPLLAYHRFGAGRVAALPGGMPISGSAGELSPALIGWMSSRQYSADLQVSHGYDDARLLLTVDAVAADGGWQTVAPAEAIITYPSGTSVARSLQLQAPGRYATAIETSAAGVYRANISIGDRQTAYSFYLGNDAERSYDTVAPWFRQAIDSGEIEAWTEAAAAAAIAASTGGRKMGPWWLALALGAFFALIAIEHSTAFSWLGKRLKRLESRRNSKSTSLA